MKTIEMRQAGGPDVLETGRRPLPEIQPGEVLIKVIAAGVNGPDLVQRRGHYPAPKGASDLLGLEVSGEIVAIADGVADWVTGDTICALTNGGGYAEYVAVIACQFQRVFRPLMRQACARHISLFGAIYSLRKILPKATGFWYMAARGESGRQRCNLELF